MLLSRRLLKAIVLIVGVFASGSAMSKEKKQAPDALESIRFKEGDENKNEINALKAEMLVAVTEKKAMDQAKALLKKYKGTPLEAGLWFRIAELNMRKSKTEMFFELNRQSDVIVRFLPKEVKKASSRNSIQEAIDIYDQIERRFPQFEDLDVVIFNNAFARQKLGQLAEPEKLYHKIIAQFPQSPLVPDAYLAIGEMAFDNKRFNFALENFLAIKNYSDSRVFPYGVYKAAWSYYNIKETAKGLKELEVVVAYGKKISEQGADARLDLRKEALGDMTLFFEDVYPATQAYEYFKRQAGELELEPLLLRLSSLYKHHDRFPDREAILKTLLSKLPKSNYAPDVQDDLIATYESMRNRLAAVEQLENFYKMCDPNESWAKAQKGSVTAKPNSKGVMIMPEHVVNCQNKLNITSLNLAGKWLKYWRLRKDPTKDLDIANSSEKAFEIYLRRNTATPEANNARFAYAELLFQRSKFREASVQYTLVGLHTAEDKLGHDSRYAAIVSLEKAVGDKWSDKDEAIYHEYANNYTNKNPKGQYRLDIEYKWALISYEKNHYDEAIPILKRLGQDYATTEKGLKSQDLYLDILNIKKDYENLKQYSAQLLKKPASPERNTKLTKIYRESYFIQIQKMEEAQKYPEAIAEYISFSNDNKGSELAPKALLNAISLQYKTGKASDAAVSSLQFYKKYPEAKETTDLLLMSVQTYESFGQLQKAAESLVELAKIDKNSKSKWLSLAADFYSLSSNYRLAKPLYNELKNSGDKKIAQNALDKLTIYEKMYSSEKDYFELIHKIANGNMQPQASIAQVQVAQRLFNQNDFSKSFNEAKKVLKMSDATPRALAQARFIQAQVLEKEFRDQSLKTSAERIALVISMKTEKLDKTQQAYMSVVKYGDPQVALQALKRLAFCYTDFATALKNIPILKDLNANDEKVFKSEIEKIILPMEEKGVETLSSALDQARKIGIRDGSVPELQAELNRLNMSKQDEPVTAIPVPNMVLPKVGWVN